MGRTLLPLFQARQAKVRYDRTRMNLQIVRLGKTKYAETDSLVEVYRKRLRKFARVELEILKSEQSLLKRLEAKEETGLYLVILDERGKEWSSEQLAQRMQTWKDDRRIKTLVFVVGDAYGISPAVKAKAKESWCLSRATFPGDIAWLVLWEQLYRAFTILEGSGYHHGEA